MRNWKFLSLIAAAALGGCEQAAYPPTAEHAPIAATFSIVARDPATGDLGVAVASKYFGVGSVVPWARTGVGAVATQALPNVAWGEEALTRLASGKSPALTLADLVAADPQSDRRQLGLIDAAGNTAAHTGKACHDWAGHLAGENHSVQGNLLAGDSVLPAMSAAFESAKQVEHSELADWLMAAMRAGQEAGGDKRGRQSAAILVVRTGGNFGANDRYIDLRVEDHPTPLTELGRLLAIHKDFYPSGRQNPQKMPPRQTQP